MSEDSYSMKTCEEESTHGRGQPSQSELVPSRALYHADITSSGSDKSIPDDAEFVFVSRKELNDLILKENITTAVAPILLLINGLPQSGKSAAIKKLLSLKPLKIKPQRGLHGLSFYELAAVAVPHHINRLHFEETTSENCYLHAIKSAVECYYRMTGQAIEGYQTMPTDLNFFGKKELNEHLKHVFDQLKEKHDRKEKPDQEHGHHHTVRTQQGQDEARVKDWDRMLSYGTGLALINIWDIGLSRTVYHFLPALCGLLHNSYSWLFFDLLRDSENLYKPPEFDSEEQLMKWRTRVHYFLRTAKLNESALSRKDVCSIFATHDGSLNSEEMEEHFVNCKEKFANEAAKIGVQELIDVDRITPIQPDRNICAKELRKKANELVYESLNSKIQVPLSFIFLRSFYYRQNDILYIRREHMKELASFELSISNDKFTEFCKLFTSFGSIIDVSLIDSSSEYIILKPNLFLKKVDKIFHSEDVELATTGILTKTKARAFFESEHAKIFTDVLVSFSLAVKLKVDQIESQILPSLSGEAIFYIPDARQKPPTTESEKPEGNALWLFRGLNAPLSHFQITFVTRFLKNNSEARIYIPSEECPTNKTTIIAYDRRHQEYVTFHIVYMGFVVKFLVEKVNEEVCTQIIQTCHDVMNQNNHNETKYNFAILCSKKPKMDELTRERHLLPSDELCPECQKDGRKNLLVDMWNAILRKDGMAVGRERKLNGDPILLDDAYAIAKKMKKLALENKKRIALELGFTEEELEHNPPSICIDDWMFPMSLIIEWGKKLKAIGHAEVEKKYSKRFLARKLLEIANQIKPAGPTNTDDADTSTSTSDDYNTLKEIASLLDNEVIRIQTDDASDVLTGQ